MREGQEWHGGPFGRHGGEHRGHGFFGHAGHPGHPGHPWHHGPHGGGGWGGKRPFPMGEWIGAEWMGPFGEGGGGGPRGGRARRGAARYILLDVLRDGPKHGYEIIKTLEERSSGRYAPSAGTVYPTLQYLEDLGWVRADQEGERKVYHLTDAGRAELEANAELIAAFWARFAEPSTSVASQHEMGFLRNELQDLARTVWGGLSEVLERDDPEKVRAMRRALERCKNDIREIIVGGAARASEPGAKEEDL